MRGNKSTLLELEGFQNNTGGIGRQYISVLEAKNNIEKNTDRKKENTELLAHGIQPDQYRNNEGRLQYPIQDILTQNTPQDNIL